MHKENNIYNCVIDSVNNILQNGIDYYVDKSDEYCNKLKEIYEYVNTKEPVVESNNTKVIKHINSNIPKEVYTSLNDYINKILDIKISVLNLENDYELYHNYDVIKKQSVNKNEITNNESNIKETVNFSTKDDIYVPNNDNKDILNLFI